MKYKLVPDSYGTYTLLVCDHFIGMYYGEAKYTYRTLRTHMTEEAARKAAEMNERETVEFEAGR